MPGYDNTGPEGVGPTGRGMGPCGEGVSPRGRRLFGFRHGRHSLWRSHSIFGNRSVSNDQEALEVEKVWLEKRLKNVKDALGGDQSE